MGAAHRERPLVNLSLGESLSLLFYLAVDLLVDAWHRYENGGHHLKKELRQLLEGGAIGQRDSTMKQRDIPMTRRHVR